MGSGGFRIGGWTISNLRYADDIILIATSPEELQELVNRVESAANEYGLQINASKTKVMTNTDRVLKIFVASGELKQVDNFIYLGSKISSDAKCSDDIKSRLAMGMAVMVKLTKIWKNKSISTQTKLRLMKSLVWSVATYGCESWVLKKAEEKQIQSFENKCTRKLLRISWTLKLTTEQVYQLAGTSPELLGSIKARKLSYFGHIIRIPKDCVEKAIMLGHVEGYRRKGRPRISWIDNVLSWSRLSGSHLLAAARDRRQWKALVHACDQPSRSDVGD